MTNFGVFSNYICEINYNLELLQFGIVIYKHIKAHQEHTKSTSKMSATMITDKSLDQLITDKPPEMQFRCEKSKCKKADRLDPRNVGYDMYDDYEQCRILCEAPQQAKKREQNRAYRAKVKERQERERHERERQERERQERERHERERHESARHERERHEREKHEREKEEKTKEVIARYLSDAPKAWRTWQSDGNDTALRNDMRLRVRLLLEIFFKANQNAGGELTCMTMRVEAALYKRCRKEVYTNRSTPFLKLQMETFGIQGMFGIHALTENGQNDLEIDTLKKASIAQEEGVSPNSIDARRPMNHDLSVVKWILRPTEPSWRTWQAQVHEEIDEQRKLMTERILITLQNAQKRWPPNIHIDVNVLAETLEALLFRSVQSFLWYKRLVTNDDHYWHTYFAEATGVHSLLIAFSRAASSSMSSIQAFIIQYMFVSTISNSPVQMTEDEIARRLSVPGWKTWHAGGTEGRQDDTAVRNAMKTRLRQLFTNHVREAGDVHFISADDPDVQFMLECECLTLRTECALYRTVKAYEQYRGYTTTHTHVLKLLLEVAVINDFDIQFQRGYFKVGLVRKMMLKVYDVVTREGLRLPAAAIFSRRPVDSPITVLNWNLRNTDPTWITWQVQPYTDERIAMRTHIATKLQSYGAHPNNIPIQQKKLLAPMLESILYRQAKSLQSYNNKEKTFTILGRGSSILLFSQMASSTTAMTDFNKQVVFIRDVAFAEIHAAAQLAAAQLAAAQLVEAQQAAAQLAAAQLVAAQQAAAQQAEEDGIVIARELTADEVFAAQLAEARAAGDEIEID